MQADWMSELFTGQSLRSLDILKSIIRGKYDYPNLLPPSADKLDWHLSQPSSGFSLDSPPDGVTGIPQRLLGQGSISKDLDLPLGLKQVMQLIPSPRGVKVTQITEIALQSRHII